MSNIYRGGLEKFCELGVCKPTADRVLLRAVMAGDDGILAMAGFDTKSAVCHQIVATGPDVSEWAFQVGDYCVHISTAGDTPDPDSRQSRFVIVRAEDIILTWDHAEAVRQSDPLQKITEASQPPNP